ncbi:MAG: cobalamin-dependent protein [Pseudomonadota bacterium]
MGGRTNADTAAQQADFREVGPSARSRHWFSSHFSVDPPSAGADVNLARTVEAEIIPRLMLAHRRRWGAIQLGLDQKGPASLNDGFEVDVDAFVQLLLGEHGDQAVAYVQSRLSGGGNSQLLILNLLAPAAQRLGEMWSDDTCDFFNVTMALGRLQKLLYSIEAQRSSEQPGQLAAKRILLCAAPGEDHTFGLSVVADALRRKGWDTVQMTVTESAEQLIDKVGSSEISIIGMSAGWHRSIEPMGSCLQAMVSALREARPEILVGGSIFSSNPEYLGGLTFDAYARDAIEAVKVADQVFEERQAKQGELCAVAYA